jgi:hypothetical protein
MSTLHLPAKAACTAHWPSTLQYTRSLLVVGIARIMYVGSIYLMSTLPCQDVNIQEMHGASLPHALAQSMVYDFSESEKKRGLSTWNETPLNVACKSKEGHWQVPVNASHNGA